MITIKKSRMKFEIPNEDVVSCQDTSDGCVYFKLRDGSELFLRNLAIGQNQMKAVAIMFTSSKAPNITIDLNNSTSPIQLG